MPIYSTYSNLRRRKQQGVLYSNTNTNENCADRVKEHGVLSSTSTRTTLPNVDAHVEEELNSCRKIEWPRPQSALCLSGSTRQRVGSDGQTHYWGHRKMALSFGGYNGRLRPRYFLNEDELRVTTKLSQGHHA